MFLLKNRNRDFDIKHSPTCTEIFVLHVYTFWVTSKLCFSEVRKHVDTFKSLFSPTSCLTIKVNFDKIQFEGYCIYRTNSSLWWKYILLTSKRIPGYSLLLLDDNLCYEENENTGKRYTLYKIWNISKNKAPIGKRRYRFEEKPCTYHFQKEKLK